MKFKKYFLLYLSLSCGGVYAQQIEIGGGLGALHYKGDLSPNFHPQFAKMGGNLFFRYNYSRSVSFKAQGMLGSFGADESKIADPFNKSRGLTFDTKVMEGGLQAEYNFLTYRKSKQYHNWSPYVFAGLAFGTYKANNLATGALNKSQMVIPFGVAIKSTLKKGWSWGIEFGTRKTFSDYLDNFGPNSYPVSSQVKNQQADYARNDMYYYTNISVSYTFYKVVCPE